MATRCGIDGPRIEQPIPVAELSKARVCGHSLSAVAGSNPAGGMDVCVVSKHKMHENQDKETSTDEVQTECKRHEKQNRGGGEIFRTPPDQPGGPPSLLYKGYRVIPGGKAAGAWR